MASMMFLGFSVVIFCISYGIMFLLMPTLFNEVYSFLEAYMDKQNISSDWRDIYDQNKAIVQFFIPLVLLLGTFLMILRVALSASAKGES